MARKLYRWWTVLCFVSVLAVAGCDKVVDRLEELESQQAQAQAEGAATPNAAPAVPVRRASDKLTIATFNIQVLGDSKAKKADVMEILADVISRFDVVAIQELRTKNDRAVLDGLLNLVNARGLAYQYIVGPRLGRSVSKEQYVFMFDSTRVRPDATSMFTVGDPTDLLHREPMVTRFQTLAAAQPFTFTLVNIHTDPDETRQELDALDDVFLSIQHGPAADDDVILLGDLNVDQDHLGQLGQLPNITWTVRGEPTNTRQNHSYDNIVFDSTTTGEFTGRCGVLNLITEYQLTQQDALKVSDHMPVWAEFSLTESVGRVARRPR